jgi:hypothetical protein
LLDVEVELPECVPDDGIIKAGSSLVADYGPDVFDSRFHLSCTWTWMRVQGRGRRRRTMLLFGYLIAVIVERSIVQLG